MGVGARPALIRTVVTVLIALVGTVGVQPQSFQDAFRDGIAAFDQKRWAEAVRQFQIAARARTDTGDNIRLYGNRFENYLPQYFLGRALYEMGDFQGAARAFDASEQSGAVRRTKYYQPLQELRREAQRRILAVATVPSTTTIPLPPPSSSSTTTSSTGVAPPPADLVRTADQAVQRADQARQAFERARDLEEMRRVNAEISRVESRARMDFEEARRLLDSGRRGSSKDLSDVLAQAQSALSGFQRALQLTDEAHKRVLTTLVEATRPYFNGRYSVARVELNKLNYDSGFPAAQVRLFRAAAAYSLYLTGGERDQRLRQEAETNVRECRRLAIAGFKPDAKAFSPRFIQFFASTS